MSMATGQQLMGTATGAMSNPRQWNSKIPRGFKAGYQQQYTPEQMNLFQQQFGQVGPESYLSQLAGGDEGAFQEMEEPAWRNFSAAQGQLASRFSGMGGGQGQRALSSQKSSGFRNTAGQLGADFAQDLAARRLEYRRQAINDLMGFSNQLLKQRPYEQFLSRKQPKQNSGWGGLIGAGIGGAGGFLMGGPSGALGGAKLGYGVGSSF